MTDRANSVALANDCSRGQSLGCSALLPGQFLRVITGDCRTVLRELPDESVNCCVTSPPYWGLRNYGHADQIGQEETPEAYVETMREVFAEVWRVMREDGTLWLNIGDSYSGSGKGGNPGHSPHVKQRTNSGSLSVRGVKRNGRKPKDLIGVPWLVAFALQRDGWYLRSDIIWHKPNCMPESVMDRPSRCHEYLFLLTKSERYYYDHAAIKEPCSESFQNDGRWKTGPTDKNEKSGYAESGAQNPKSVHRIFKKQNGHGRRHAGFNERWDANEANGTAPMMRNKRDVWTISPANYPQAHFATYPPALIKPCILAGCPARGVVLDPFGGSGTTGAVALELGRRAVLVELNPDYTKLINERCATTPGLPLAG